MKPQKPGEPHPCLSLSTCPKLRATHIPLTPYFHMSSQDFGPEMGWEPSQVRLVGSGVGGCMWVSFPISLQAFEGQDC